MLHDFAAVELVVVIDTENSLHFLLFEGLLNSLYLLCVLPLCVVHVVLVEVVHRDVRHIRRLHPPTRKQIPVKVLEPSVLFQFFCLLSSTKPVLRIPLQTTIYKVS